MSEKSLPPEIQQMLVQYQTLREHQVRIDAELKLVEAELSDIESILDTLKNTSDDVELYKALGHVIIKKSKAEVVKELEDRKELLIVKRDKYRKQLDFVNKQVSELEAKIKEALSKHGLTASR
ncbi:MAG: prefoldin subunit beta [Desulfurococcus sp.]|nr:prefoldin subunit beta [Desulfurococcus sp.]